MHILCDRRVEKNPIAVHVAGKKRFEDFVHDCQE